MPAYFSSWLRSLVPEESLKCIRIFKDYIYIYFLKDGKGIGHRHTARCCHRQDENPLPFQQTYYVSDWSYMVAKAALDLILRTKRSKSHAQNKTSN